MVIETFKYKEHNWQVVKAFEIFTIIPAIFAYGTTEQTRESLLTTEKLNLLMTSFPQLLNTFQGL